jgi:two-component sensor histidine kinase
MEIETDLRIQNVDLHMSVAENLGVIVNELLTNSVKFAFSMNCENRFRLEMSYGDHRVPHCGFGTMDLDLIQSR